LAFGSFPNRSHIDPKPAFPRKESGEGSRVICNGADEYLSDCDVSRSEAITLMSLEHFTVVREHIEPLNRVLIHCFDDRQIVLVFIAREDVDDYFHRSDLNREDRNLLIDRNLGLLEPIIREKYEAGEVGTYADPHSRHSYPQIDLTLADLQKTAEKMTATVLDMAAAAGFRRA
jgi:hypothetical protein